jgi:hypothetical protein
MLFSHLHKYNHKYVIVLLLAIVTGLTLFAAFKTRSIDTFIPLQPNILTKEEENFYPCNNFCGPKGECAITREQCVADFECADCIKTELDPDSIIKVQGYNSTFLEGFSSTNTNGSSPICNSPERSLLTTDITNFATVIENEKGKESNVPKMNLGVDLWTKAYNYGLKLEKSKLNYDFVMYPGELEYQPKYNMTKSVTGMFDDFGPTAANAAL